MALFIVLFPFRGGVLFSFARWTVMSPYRVRARTATVCSEPVGALSPTSSLRTRPLFADRSSQAGTPGFTSTVTSPKPLSTSIEPLDTSRSVMLP